MVVCQGFVRQQGQGGVPKCTDDGALGETLNGEALLRAGGKTIKRISSGSLGLAWLFTLSFNFQTVIAQKEFPMIILNSRGQSHIKT